MNAAPEEVWLGKESGRASPVPTLFAIRLRKNGAHALVILNELAPMNGFLSYFGAVIEEPNCGWSVHVRYDCRASSKSTRAGVSMKIHEYQAKEILRKYNVPVPGGEMATTLEEADVAAKAVVCGGKQGRCGEGADSCGRPG